MAGRKPAATRAAEAAAEMAAKPPVIEGPGRYVVYQAPDGGWVLARAVDLCKTCANCGCGEQAPAVQIPAMVIALAQRQGKGGVMAMLKTATGHG